MLLGLYYLAPNADQVLHRPREARPSDGGGYADRRRIGAYGAAPLPTEGTLSTRTPSTDSSLTRRVSVSSSDSSGGSGPGGGLRGGGSGGVALVSTGGGSWEAGGGGRAASEAESLSMWGMAGAGDLADGRESAEGGQERAAGSSLAAWGGGSEEARKEQSGDGAGRRGRGGDDSGSAQEGPQIGEGSGRSGRGGDESGWKEEEGKRGVVERSEESEKDTGKTKERVWRGEAASSALESAEDDEEEEMGTGAREGDAETEEEGAREGTGWGAEREGGRRETDSETMATAESTEGRGDAAGEGQRGSAWLVG